MTLRIGRQRELPQRPGDYRTAKGDMNKVPETAHEEAEEMRQKTGRQDAPKPASAEKDPKADG